jgi:hypothetical protein
MSTPKYTFNDSDVGLYEDEYGNLVATDELIIIAGGVENIRFFTECPKCGYSWKAESETESKNGGGERSLG